MKSLIICFVLAFFSFQAGATGYSHNMFVAHKKLQAGKESGAPAQRVTTKKVRMHKVHAKVSVAPGNRSSFFVSSESASPVSAQATLNQRILQEGPSSFFNAEKEEAYDSMVVKMVAVVRYIVYSFVGVPI